MKEKPKDGQYTRKGEPDGKRLSPGERAINWAKAIAIIVPLIGIGAVAKDPVVNYLNPLPTPEGEVSEIIEGGFQAQVREHVRTNNEKIHAIEARIQKLEGISKNNDSALEKRIVRIEELVN